MFLRLGRWPMGENSPQTHTHTHLHIEPRLFWWTTMYIFFLQHKGPCGPTEGAGPPTSCLIQSAGLTNTNRQLNVLFNKTIYNWSFILIVLCLCGECVVAVLDPLLAFVMSKSTLIINRITAASDICHFYFSELDFSAATVCLTPPSESFNPVIRMACCVMTGFMHRCR